jgi:hypothetical protein
LFEGQGLGCQADDAEMATIAALTPPQLMDVARRRLKAEQLLTVVASSGPSRSVSFFSDKR